MRERKREKKKVEERKKGKRMRQEMALNVPQGCYKGRSVSRTRRRRALRGEDSYIWQRSIAERRRDERVAKEERATDKKNGLSDCPFVRQRILYAFSSCHTLCLKEVQPAINYQRTLNRGHRVRFPSLESMITRFVSPPLIPSFDYRGYRSMETKQSFIRRK